jgi:hypothetical protein
MWLEFLRSKDEVFDRFKKVQAMAESEGRCKLRAFRSDRGGEFNSVEFRKHCESLGVKHYTTAPYSPQQNAVVECRNQTVVEMARCLIKSMGMPSFFWAEAVTTAVYILNRAPTRSLDSVTPYEAWHGHKTNVQHLRTFGCTVHVKKVGPGVTKLSDRSTPMVFVGYEEGSKSYRVYNPATKKVQVNHDVIFEESRPWSWNAEQNSDASSVSATHMMPETFTVIYTTEPGKEELDSGVHMPCPSTPAPGTARLPSKGLAESDPCTPAAAPAARWAMPPTHDDAWDVDSGPIRYRRLSCVFDETEADAVREPFERCLLSAEQPRDVDEALKDEFWKAAMDNEMASIHENGIWVHCSLPAGHKAIPPGR